MNWNSFNLIKLFEKNWYRRTAKEFVRTLGYSIQKKRKNDITHDQIAKYLNDEVFEKILFDENISIEYVIMELEKQYPYLQGRLKHPEKYD